MPRRISDYPDAFAGWNLISSFGSIISVVATWLFLYIVYVQLVEGNATSKYPWLIPQFFSDLFQTLFNRNYNSLEWSLNSPPKPHAFVSLPLQSFHLSISQLLEIRRVSFVKIIVANGLREATQECWAENNEPLPSSLADAEIVNVFSRIGYDPTPITHSSTGPLDLNSGFFSSKAADYDTPLWHRSSVDTFSDRDLFCFNLDFFGYTPISVESIFVYLFILYIIYKLFSLYKK
jgi:hypothetical protein